MRRCNDDGLEGRRDRRREERPSTYGSDQVGILIAASLTDPQTLGLPFGRWTRGRLAAYLAEDQGIAMQRSRLGEILPREGLRWRQQARWFGERPDPAFATNVVLWTRTHPRWKFVFPPPDAAARTRIGPWWEILRSLALKGGRFETWGDLCCAVAAATCDGNAHRHPCDAPVPVPARPTGIACLPLPA